MNDDIPELRGHPIEQRFQRRLAHAVQTGRIFPFLAGTTFGLALVAGTVITLVDHKEFKNIGVGVWWAIVTLATVGYGDFVPENTPGRIVGSVTILFGVTFLAVLTATVTSLFVSSEQHEAQQKLADQATEIANRNAAAMARIERQLEAIEEKLGIEPDEPRA